jgi:hypothetical protein
VLLPVSKMRGTFRGGGKWWHWESDDEDAFALTTFSGKKAGKLGRNGALGAIGDHALLVSIA